MADQAKRYKTQEEWRQATDEWNAAGRPGGNHGRPVFSPGNCEACGGIKLPLGLFPAFKPLTGICLCEFPEIAASVSSAEREDDTNV
jgi:hypothetical protein